MGVNSNNRDEHLTKTFNLFLAIKVMHRGAQHVRKPARIHIQQSATSGCHGNVDILLGQCLAQLFGLLILDSKSDDAALLHSTVSYDHSGKRAESRAQLVGKRLNAPPDSVHSPLKRVVNSYSQPNLSGIIGLPV